MNTETIGRRAAVFEALYRDGQAYSFVNTNTGRRHRLVFQTRHVCDVHFPTGRVVACDPTEGFSFGCRPFTRRIPTGTYPVVISTTGPKKKPKVASAKLILEPTKPEKWELALLPKQKPERLKNDEFFGFSVDAGMAAIGDYEIFNEVRTKYDRDEWWRSVVDGWKTSQRWSLSSNNRDNIAMFETGYGDGNYPSFFGTTRRGRIVCLLIDFFVVPWNC